jgi:ABC-type transport system involved in cytochrome bd biosynthesis fused ATPase/permease subunit
LRHKAAIIEQEPKILRGPLSLNLRLGDSTASKERILEAAYRAQLKDLILGEPDGISMNLLEGGKNLSVGQKQRIAIARAILKDTELIIFDEPTASLDAATEKVIVDLIQDLSKEKFVIIISHKSATTDICESIYTFSSGALTKTK